MMRRLLKDRRGATAVEYALLASLIAVAGIGAMTDAGATVSKAFAYARVGMLPSSCGPGSHRVVSMADGVYCKAN